MISQRKNSIDNEHRRLDDALNAQSSAERPRFDDAKNVLVGGECPNCSARMWPARAVCYRCHSAPIREVDLPSRGTAMVWSRVLIPVGNIEAPYIMALVDLGGVRVFGHIRGDVTSTSPGCAVSIRVDGTQTPPYWFEL